jgi:hypothetical protein
MRWNGGTMKKFFKVVAVVIVFLLSFTLFRKVAAKLKLKFPKKRMAKLA